MLGATVIATALGLPKTIIESVESNASGEIVIRVRPYARERHRCSVCRATCPRYDRGFRGPRRWRSLDVGLTRCWIVSDASRVRCRRHGVMVAAVPWARQGATHTKAFEDTIAWLAVRMDKTSITSLMRIGWRTVGTVLERVIASGISPQQRLVGLRRIGIDEISYRRGFKYITVVVDHDTGALVWAGPGRGVATLKEFFNLLGKDGCAALTHVSADGAQWIAKAVTKNAPKAVLCRDPFHVIADATKALDQVRRQAVAALKSAQVQAGEPQVHRSHGNGRTSVVTTGEARDLKKTRWALVKNPEKLTPRQEIQLDLIARTHPDVYLGYQLKENLRAVYALSPEDAGEGLDTWIEHALSSGLPPFIQLALQISKAREVILNAITNGLSNGRVEAINTTLRMITRRAYGFHSAQAFIALGLLTLGRPKPTLPSRK